MQARPTSRRPAWGAGPATRISITQQQRQAKWTPVRSSRATSKSSASSPLTAAVSPTTASTAATAASPSITTQTQGQEGTRRSQIQAGNIRAQALGNSVSASGSVSLGRVHNPAAASTASRLEQMRQLVKAAAKPAQLSSAQPSVATSVTRAVARSPTVSLQPTRAGAAPSCSPVTPGAISGTSSMQRAAAPAPAPATAHAPATSTTAQPSPGITGAAFNSRTAAGRMAPVAAADPSPSAAQPSTVPHEHFGTSSSTKRSVSAPHDRGGYRALLDRRLPEPTSPGQTRPPALAATPAGPSRAGTAAGAAQRVGVGMPGQQQGQRPPQQQQQLQEQHVQTQGLVEESMLEDDLLELATKLQSISFHRRSTQHSWRDAGGDAAMHSVSSAAGSRDASAWRRRRRSSGGSEHSGYSALTMPSGGEFYYRTSATPGRVSPARMSPGRMSSSNLDLMGPAGDRRYRWYNVPEALQVRLGGFCTVRR